jgi:chromosome segregation ATPase
MDKPVYQTNRYGTIKGMKRILLVSILFVFVFASVPLAFAVDAIQTPTASDDTAALKQRSEERKARLKTRLDNAQFKRLGISCSGAQGKLGASIARFENSDKPYRVKYDNYLQRLEKLQARLKQNNVDTTKLDSQIVTLKEKIQTLKTAIDTFTQAVNDAKSIDCKNDTTGFRAALDDAKNNAVAVRAARTDLEKFARETIKATIEELKAQNKSTETNKEQR